MKIYKLKIKCNEMKQLSRYKCIDGRIGKKNNVIMDAFGMFWSLFIGVRTGIFKGENGI